MQSAAAAFLHDPKRAIVNGPVPKQHTTHLRYTSTSCSHLCEIVYRGQLKCAVTKIHRGWKGRNRANDSRHLQKEKQHRRPATPNGGTHSRPKPGNKRKHPLNTATMDGKQRTGRSTHAPYSSRCKLRCYPVPLLMVSCYGSCLCLPAYHCVSL